MAVLAVSSFRRIIHDILEIIEQSLDITLAGNALRYRFVDTPILDGISIHETCTSVIVLVPTVCSIHRLVFPHPDRLHRQVSLYIYISIVSAINAILIVYIFRMNYLAHIRS